MTKRIPQSRIVREKPLVIIPEHNLKHLHLVLEKTLSVLEEKTEAWTASSAKGHNGKYQTVPAFQIRRTPTGRVSLSEERSQNRSGHQKFMAQTAKANLLDAFLDFEKAMLSIPALAHPHNKIGTASRHHNKGRVALLVNQSSITCWNGARTPLNSLRWLVETLHGISVNENSPLWLVDRTVVPAKSADEAIWISVALDRARQVDDKKRNMNIKTVPLVGRLENPANLKKAFETRFEKKAKAA